MRDSCGSSGTGETPQAFTPRRLTARPVESEHLEGKSTTPHYLVNSNKVCENSHKKRESTKPFILIRYLMIIAMGLTLILCIINDFNFNFIKNIYLLLGIGSIIDGFESFLKKENKRQMLLNIGIAFMWFVVFLI